METTSNKNEERTEMWIDKEELKSVIDDTEIGAMKGVILIECGTKGAYFWVQGEKATLVKAVTQAALIRELPIGAIVMNAAENILAELAKEGGEA